MKRAKGKKLAAVLMASLLSVTALSSFTVMAEEKAEVDVREGLNYVGIGPDEVIENTENQVSPFSYGDTMAYTYNDGGNSLSDVIGLTREQLLFWLGQHINDTYYLTTPYRGGDYRNPNGDCGGAYGSEDIPGQAGMNCTGFVWHALTAAGGNGGIIPAETGWVTLLRNNNIEYRTYTGSNINDIINTIVRDDGYAEPGDIIWTWDINANPPWMVDGLSNGLSGDHHIGIYTGTYFDSMEHRYNYNKTIGDTNGWWHQPGVDGVNDIGVRITNVAPAVQCGAITVIKLKGGYPGLYPDIKSGSWYHDYVQDVTDKGLMTGYKNGYFGPLDKLTRGQFATILWRMSGSPSVEYKNLYLDAADGMFYSQAITWASEEGIINGYGNGYFGTTDYITREQTATMLFRYASLIGKNHNFQGNIDDYPDGPLVSDFARDGMIFATGSQLITGDNGKLNPQGEVNRAVCATLISRFTNLDVTE